MKTLAPYFGGIPYLASEASARGVPRLGGPGGKDAAGGKAA